MKIKLAVSKKLHSQVEAALLRHGLEIDEQGEYTLIETNPSPDRLLVRDRDSESRVFLSPEEIVTVESYGHSVEIHTKNHCYYTSERIYQLAATLDPEKFLRISNSVIVATGRIRAIRPTFSMKFILTMDNGRQVDVTRSYYYIFKEFFGI